MTRLVVISLPFAAAGVFWVSVWDGGPVCGLRETPKVHLRVQKGRMRATESHGRGSRDFRAQAEAQAGEPSEGNGRSPAAHL